LLTTLVLRSTSRLLTLWPAGASLARKWLPVSGSGGIHTGSGPELQRVALARTFTGEAPRRLRHGNYAGTEVPRCRSICHGRGLGLGAGRVRSGQKAIAAPVLSGRRSIVCTAIAPCMAEVKAATRPWEESGSSVAAASPTRRQIGFATGAVIWREASVACTPASWGPCSLDDPRARDQLQIARLEVRVPSEHRRAGIDHGDDASAAVEQCAHPIPGVLACLADAPRRSNRISPGARNGEGRRTATATPTAEAAWPAGGDHGNPGPHLDPLPPSRRGVGSIAAMPEGVDEESKSPPRCASACEINPRRRQ
jgi:hypothetical protein